MSRGSKYDKCIRKVSSKIKKSKIKKYYRCDSKGNPNPRGRKRCKSSVYKICSELR